MPVSAWWDSLDEGQAVDVVILNVDLGRHTETASKYMASDVGAFEKFKSFGKAASAKLETLGFPRLHWLGDGGVFAKRYHSAADAESVCAAADAVFAVFDKQLAPHGYPLHLRISADLLPTVYISRTTGYWFSLRLNQFLKYERDIALPNAFVITGELIRGMSDQSDEFARFSSGKPRQILLPDGATFVSYTDKEHQPSVPESPDRFETWLADTERSWSAPSRQVPTDISATAVGDSLILFSSLEDAGFHQSELIQITRREDFRPVLGKHRATYEQLEAELRKLSGKKASVRCIIPPLTDDPILRIQWELIDYFEARAFMGLVEEHPDSWSDIRNSMLEIENRRIPSILVTHNLMILADPTPMIVVAHRRKEGSRPGGFCNNRWSASFEEQFSPVEGQRNGRKIERDLNLYSTIYRGVREELLGEQYTGTTSISVHAVLVEVLNMNIGVLGLIVVPNLTFPELVQCWQHPDTVDRFEHDALAAFPINRETIEQCLREERLPHEVWQNFNKHTTIDLDESDHLWHPTSKARLALALWLIEAGKLGF